MHLYVHVPSKAVCLVHFHTKYMYTCRDIHMLEVTKQQTCMSVISKLVT